MLNLYLAELKKLKRQKSIRMVGFIALFIPIVFLLICLRDKLPYRALVAANVLFGNFLVAPCLFAILMLTLFQMEEQNGTMKNIIVANVEKWKIFLAKLMIAFSVVLIFAIVTWLYSLIGGLFLKGFANVEKAFCALLISAIASIGASMPVLLIIVILRKKYLISMVLINCFVIIDFILVWQLTMMQGLNLHLPILIGYRITYPMQAINYGANITDAPGVKMLYYPLGVGICLLIATTIFSLLFSILIYKKQEI